MGLKFERQIGLPLGAPKTEECISLL